MPRPSCVFIARLLVLLVLRPAESRLAAQAPASPSRGAAPTPAQSTERPPAAPPADSSQPLAYSHRLHAGDLQIQCTYCHSGARRSAAASVPAVGVCTGCHRWVKNKTPEMLRLDERAAKQQPIFWRRINQLADHVYFSHQRHVATGLQCQGCHGPIEKMEQVERIPRLTMGWCVECHEQRQAPLDCSTCHD